MFKTKNNGWGLRALDDIPQGAFICTYAGNLYTDQEGDERGATFGDTYFADLDLIEQAEAEKEEFKVNPDLDEGFEEEKKQAETAVGEENKPVEGSEEKEKINSKNEQTHISLILHYVADFDLSSILGREHNIQRFLINFTLRW